MLIAPKRSPLKVHVNQHIIRQRGEHPITVRRGSERFYGDTIEITGPSRIVYRPNDPLDCGAKVWIETDHPINLAQVS